MDDGLAVVDLRHRFGEVVALDGLGFEVGAGEIVGLVGRNGAGKTTTMRSIMGIAHPNRGAVRWRGQRVGESDRLASRVYANALIQGGARLGWRSAGAGGSKAGEHIPVNRKRRTRVGSMR